MRLFSLVLLATTLMPGLCLAQPEVTDDISNQPVVNQPAPPEGQVIVPDDSEEIIMPATPVRGLPKENATILDMNGTLIDANGTLPLYNATLPGFNSTLPQYNATLPNINATLPVYNATLPRVNATAPVHNATRPVVNVQTPGVNATAPVVSVADFLVKAPENKPEPPKPEPVKPEPQKSAQVKPESKNPEPAKPEPRPQKVASGQGLKIPPDAAKTGDVSFLEGCWKGYRPEYNTKRMVTERFCFDNSGVGKRTISDPAYAGNCYGATRALLSKDGVLHMSSEEAVCTSGMEWGASDMTCKGEGEQTPCYWDFTALQGKPHQSYKISFVRE